MCIELACQVHGITDVHPVSAEYCLKLLEYESLAGALLSFENQTNLRPLIWILEHPGKPSNDIFERLRISVGKDRINMLECRAPAAFPWVSTEPFPQIQYLLGRCVFKFRIFARIERNRLILASIWMTDPPSPQCRFAIDNDFVCKSINKVLNALELHNFSFGDFIVHPI